jgi:Spy/CpxP family protein refolding chaperone
MREEFGLSEEQVREILDTDLFFHEKQSALKAELKKLRMDMEQVCLSDSFDRKNFLQLAERIADLKKTLYWEKIEACLAIRHLLTPEQIEKLRLHRMNRKKAGSEGLSDSDLIQHLSRKIFLSP